MKFVEPKYVKLTKKQLVMDYIYLVAVGALCCPWATTKIIAAAGTVIMAVLILRANGLNRV